MLKQVNKLKKILAFMFVLITLFSTAQPIFPVSSSEQDNGLQDNGIQIFIQVIIIQA